MFHVFCQHTWSKGRCAGAWPVSRDFPLGSVREVMKRGPALAVAAILAVELAYILWTTLPEFVPQPRCIPCMYAFVISPLPWLWMGFAMLLFLNAVAVLLRKRFGVVLGFLTQAVVLIGLARNLSQEIGWSLSSGTSWSGLASWYPELLFAGFALCAAVGPAITLLLGMISTLTTPQFPI